MKHIKKRYLASYDINFDVDSVFKSVPIDHEKVEDIKKNNYAGYFPMIVTNNEIIQAFIYSFKGKQIPIPEPNPIVIYFHVAQSHLQRIFNSKAELFSEFEKRQPDNNRIMQFSYEYFSSATTCAIFMFNSIEAFINLLIPEDYTYQKETHQKTESYNKAQIQRNIQFDEKIKNIIPEIQSTSFHQMHPAKYERILKLKDLRDEITHTKTHLESKPNWYKVLFTKLLDFDFFKTIIDCRDYINFHQENLIEECNCGENY